jgi:hypothetical protein
VIDVPQSYHSNGNKIVTRQLFLYQCVCVYKKKVYFTVNRLFICYRRKSYPVLERSILMHQTKD